MPSNFQTYTLLCKSDVERAEWKEKIIPLLEQNEGIQNLNVAVFLSVYVNPASKILDVVLI